MKRHWISAALVLGLAGLALGQATAPAGVPASKSAGQVEYFCPMHEQVVQGQPGKCPVCGMPLTERGKAADKTAGEPMRAGVAQMKLTGEIAERQPEFSLLTLMGAGRETLRDWLNRLEAAGNDPAIDAVALELGSPKLSWAKAVELAGAVERLAKKKPVYTHVTSGGLGTYLVAAAGTELTMEPAGELEIVGLAGEMMFFQGTLAKLGIGAQFVQIGRFKGAAESFTQAGPSKELQGEIDKVFDGRYAEICERLAAARKFKVTQAKAILDEGPFTAGEALKAKLVDRLAGRHEWTKQVEKATFARTGRDRLLWKYSYGRAAREMPDFSNPFTMVKLLLAGSEAPRLKGPTVAIVHAEGTIVGGAGGEGMFGQKLIGAAAMVKVLDEVRENEKIKAVVFRVNSPGGSALASELIYQALARLAKEKPVVVSVSDMAASGGYYIAVAGQTIVADPGAIVGSIGVVTGKLAIKGFLEEKLGITTHSITRGKNAGMSLLRPWDERELEVVRRHAQGVYDQFVDRVKAGRGKRIVNIEAVAQGRIFTAAQALQAGMIDEIGGLREAMAAAKKAARLEKCETIVLPRPKTLLEALGDEEGGEVRMPVSLGGGEQWLGRLAGAGEGVGYLLTLTQVLSGERVLAAVPWHMTIRP